MISFENAFLFVPQNLGQHLIRHNQAAGHMEGSLEGGTLAGRLRGLAVPAQIAVPFTVFVGKMGLAVVQKLIENVRILLIFVKVLLLFW